MNDLNTNHNEKKLKNFITIPGKDVGNKEDDPNDITPINYPIPDNKTISGSGMPITIRLFRKVVKAYYNRQNKVHELFKHFVPREKQKETALLDPHNEIVSGIYGRDTLLHILSQPRCEGIRYVNCVYRKEKSIVLFGVDRNGQPIGEKEKSSKDTLPKNLLIYEVKQESKTMSEILQMIDSKEEFVSQVILS
ncbi:hypothetical protein [Aquimarina sp. MMG016]|uniref:hypothetical protein n=1 Tax=Aquimarina sp. MMG016 TaxID=2822690 RepID=UPI001B39FCB2|nr:hypothetical protein [Aquimarina sp. MMG016]MBQ4818599.1 hypothetical protein [Aquimarina sp. MMG016]